MQWLLLYRDALEYAKRRIAKQAVFAYNVNIDVVRYLADEPKLAEFSRVLAGCVRRGEQREVQVDRSTISSLLKEVGRDEMRMGGQAGNMGNAASALGVRCYVHVLLKSREQLKLFEHPERVFVASDGFKRADMVDVSCEAPLHLVLEFRKGYEFAGFRAPSSNRLILSWNPPGSVLKIDEEFAKRIREVIPQVSHAVISGFHNLTLRDRFERKIERVAAQIEEWKRANKKIKVHVELGSFQHPRILKEVASSILPLSDSIGFDEYELKQLKKILKVEGGVWSACDRICTMFASVVFHSPPFSFSLDAAESRQEPLLFGSLLAGYKAATGRNPSFSELDRFVKKVSLNENGVRKYEEFKKAKFRNKAAFAPALNIGEPKITVGLGDCFTAGYFLIK